MSKHPPSRSTGILKDIKYFFLDRPGVETAIRFHNPEERRLYSESILQRMGIGVDNYRLLNIHRIGIEAPAVFVFGELLKWNGDSSCWPNHIARVSLHDGKLDEIRVNLFGLPHDPYDPRKSIFGFQLFHLFNMNAIRIQHTPEPFDFDNARYLLYECSGGYPIGVFSMYVRTSIPERGEKEMAQLFMMVGFNFYGHTTLSRFNPLNKLWEAIHNRATTHILNRFKQLSEWRFEQFRNDSPAAGDP
jgi:hypothetical protein